MIAAPLLRRRKDARRPACTTSWSADRSTSGSMSVYPRPGEWSNPIDRSVEADGLRRRCAGAAAAEEKDERAGREEQARPSFGNTSQTPDRSRSTTEPVPLFLRRALKPLRERRVGMRPLH